MLKIILFINLIIIIINIYFKYFRKENNFIFKNNDKVTINLVKNSYKNISNLLNLKYAINNSNNYKKERIHKKKISIYFEDFVPSFYVIPQYKILKKLLRKKYDLEIKSRNPDYLIFDVHGCNHMNEAYQKSIN